MKKDILIKLMPLVILATIFWFVNGYYIPNFRARYNQLQLLQRELAVKQALTGRESPSAFVNQLQNFAPSDLQKSQLTSSISQFARETKVNLSQLSIDAVRASANEGGDLKLDESAEAGDFSGQSEAALVNTLKQGALKITVQGGKRELYEFIGGLESLDRYIEVDTFAMVVGKDQSDIQATINATIYYTGL